MSHFGVWLQEYSIMTLRIEPLFNMTQGLNLFFSMTQRIVSVLSILPAELNPLFEYVSLKRTLYFRWLNRIEPWFFKYDWKAWALFQRYDLQELNLFEKCDSSRLNFLSMIQRIELFFFFEKDSQNQGLIFFNLTQILEYDSKH